MKSCVKVREAKTMLDDLMLDALWYFVPLSAIMGNMCYFVCAAAVCHYMQLCAAVCCHRLQCATVYYTAANMQLLATVCYWVLMCYHKKCDFLYCVMLAVCYCVLICNCVRHILHLFAAVAFRDGCTGYKGNAEREHERSIWGPFVCQNICQNLLILFCQNICTNLLLPSYFVKIICQHFVLPLYL